MEDIFKNEGDDYSMYSENSKKCIASCVSIAVSIKAVLDTQILTENRRLLDYAVFIGRTIKIRLFEPLAAGF